MAIFCKLNENNIIVNAEVVDDTNGATQEGGEAFLRQLYRTPSQRWIKVIPGDPKLDKYSIGWVYRDDLKGFITPKPFPSWTLNETTCDWIPPVPLPEDATPPGVEGPKYFWDEENKIWYQAPYDIA